MRGSTESTRTLLPWLALVLLLSGCRSAPTSYEALPPESSLLALEVVFPVSLGRDPSLVQVFFVRGPIHSGLDELPELIPASFVQLSRAYLLDPEPGTYSVVAVSAAYAPPSLNEPVAGVAQTTWSGTSSDAMIFPAELIERTRTTVGRGQVVYMGTLSVARGDRIDAKVGFQDELQRRIAEQLRPGVTSESGLAGWLKRTRKVNPEKSSLSIEARDRESFFEGAPADLGDSPWAVVISRAAAAEDAPERARVRRRKSSLNAAAIDPAANRNASGDANRSVEAPDGMAAKPLSSEAESAVASLPSPEAEPAISTASPQAGRAISPSPNALSDPQPAVAPAATSSSGAEPATAALSTATLESEPASDVLASLAPQAEAAPESPEPQPFAGIPPESDLYEIEYGMSHHEVREILGGPDGRLDRQTSKAWIPFYNGPGADLRDWIYTGKGRVVFTLYRGKLEVTDVVYDPNEGK